MTIADKLTLLTSSKEALRVKLGLPKSLPFSEYYKHSYPFDPMTLFANGEQGVWYDPSDKSTLFQDAAGIVPVTKDGDPVGLMLDKSQGLEGDVTNVAKPFITDRSTDALEVTNTSEGTKLVIKTITNSSGLSIFEVDKTYKLTVVYTIPETTSDISVYNTTNGVSNFLFTATKGVRNKEEVTLTAKNTNLYFRTPEGEITIHEVVLKEIKGNHATQPLAASRPTYRTDGVLHWLEFDGADDYLVTTAKQYADFSYYTAASSFFNLSLQVIMGGRSDANTRSHIGHQSASVAGGVGTLQGRSLQIEEQFTQDSVVLGSLVYDANIVSLRQNKTKTFQTNLLGTPLPPQDNFVGALSTSGTPSSYLKGSIYGIIAINSAEYKEDVTNYLANKSGVTL